VLFLVEIEMVHFVQGDDAFLVELTARERERGQELVEAGAIRNIWRVPGRRANVGIWEAADANDLHAAIASLPAFRWMEARVTPLAEHPLSPS
jgi:muconolactone D-isomerase